jgi:hypothetical protein
MESARDNNQFAGYTRLLESLSIGNIFVVEEVVRADPDPGRKEPR